MTYDQLVTLDAIVKHGSFKAASEVLHKTQPSISVSIKKLEEYIGFPIFSREEYRPKLTDKGRAFYNKSMVALSSFHDLEVFSKELSMGFESEINLSLDTICPIHKIESVLSNFFEPQIATTLNLSVEIMQGLYEKVLNGECDFGIGSIFTDDRNIEAIPFVKVKLIPVIKNDFAHTVKGSITNLKCHSQIIVRSTDTKKDSVTIGVNNEFKHWYTSDMGMKQQLIENGLGWGRLPEHLIRKSLDNQILSVVEDIPTIQTIEIQLYLIRNKQKIMGPNTKSLWNYLVTQSEHLS